VLGDRIQLQRVVLNLAIDGIKAMREVRDGSRELLARSDGHKVSRAMVAI
jgi:hypothetical protein